jgi:hypothetical protein
MDKMQRFQIIYVKGSLFWDVTPCSRLTFNGLRGVISHNTEPFITIALGISNPTLKYVVYNSLYFERVTTVWCKCGLRMQMASRYVNS